MASDPSHCTRSSILCLFLPSSLTGPRAVTSQPALLGVNRDRLRSRWQRLSELAAQHPPWHDQLAGYAPPSLARCLVASDAAVERLATVLRLGKTGDEAAAKLKRLLIMSEERFKDAFGLPSSALQEPLPPHTRAEEKVLLAVETK